MLTIACLSLSGGQGKTTVCVMLARYLAQQNLSVLCVDADPQANLTTFLGQAIEPDEPTLLEVLKGVVEPSVAVYKGREENLSFIPADDGLDTAQDYLSSSGFGAIVLKQRLQKLEDFDVCLIDSPPQRSQMCKTIIGAAQHVIIPAEASIKGYGSLVRTIDAISELKEAGVTEAELIGVVPFKDRWVASNQTIQSKTAIGDMAEEVGQDLILPSILDGEPYKKALAELSTLHEIGFPDRAYPIEVLVEKVKELLR